MIQLNSHLRSIDIMKGIAMIMVILVHYEQSFNMCEWFYYLKMGCPIFFVCSGFGVMSLIKRKYSLLLENTNELHLFYYSRFKALAGSLTVFKNS